MTADHTSLDLGSQPKLRSTRLSTGHLVAMQVSASSPLTVLAGGVTTTFALTGNSGAVVAFLLVGLACWLAAEGFTAMAQHVSSVGAFYAYIGRGLGPVAGVSAAGVALVAYNAIQICLYGLFGATVADLMAGFGIDLPWWVWSLVLLAVLAALGAARVVVGVSVVVAALAVETVVVIAFIVTALGSPGPAGITAAGWSPLDLIGGPGLGAVLALTVAAFVGFESGVVYSEEARDARRTVPRAMRIGVAIIAVGYAVSAWALLVVVGPADIQAQSAEQGPGLVFGTLAGAYGDLAATLATVVLLTSVAAAMLAFHMVVARYLFSLGRERILPAWFETVSPRSAGPIAGSLSQTAIAAVTVIAFAAFGADPLLQLFAWLSGLAALGVVALMAATSLAVVVYFRADRHAPASVWQRAIAPSLGTVALSGLAVLIVANFDALTGADGVVRWLLPGLLLLAAVAGGVWGGWLQRNRPAVVARIGRGVADPADLGVQR